MYNFNHLYYFYTTVKSGGVTTAAKHLSISQPSLSCQLKVLEEYLQVKLFKKVGRKNKLTPEGDLIFGFCRKMFEISDEMHEKIIESESIESRSLHIGVSSEIAHSFVVEVISYFLKKYVPQNRPKVVIISGSHEGLCEQLKFKELDVVATQLSSETNDLINLEEIKIPVNLVCTIDKKNCPKKCDQSIAALLSEIKAQGLDEWVFPSTGTKLRTEINSFFEENSVVGNVVFESDMIECITRSVVDKIGTSFLPLSYVPKELEYTSLRSYGPKDGCWKHRLSIKCHKTCRDDVIIKTLSHSFIEVCENVNIL